VREKILLSLKRRGRQLVAWYLREAAPTSYPPGLHGGRYTDKKEYQIFLMYQEIQNGAVAKSYMTID
jgi:hypothetical protein